MQHVADHLNANGGDRKGVAERLVNQARDAGSHDNISVIVVFLKDGSISKPNQSASESERTQAEKISDNNNPDKGSKDPSSPGSPAKKDEGPGSPANDSNKNDGGGGGSGGKEGDGDSPGDRMGNYGTGGAKLAPLVVAEMLSGSESSTEGIDLLPSSDFLQSSGESEQMQSSLAGSDDYKGSSNNETSDEFLHAQLSSDSGQSPAIQSGQESRSTGQGSRSAGQGSTSNLIRRQKPMIVVSTGTNESESFSHTPSISQTPSANESRGEKGSDVTGVESGGFSSNQSAPKADVRSDISTSDLALLSKTATRCLSNRKAKRSKNGSTKNGSRSGSRNGRNGHHHHHHNGRNGHSKENRRIGRGRVSSSSFIAYHRTLSAPPRSRSAESNLALAQRSVQRSGDQIFEMLTGCSPGLIRKTNSSSKWTVAVEVEAASALFTDSSVSYHDRRKSDTPHAYTVKKYQSGKTTL